MLHGLFHADDVHHQFDIFEVFGFVPGDVVFDSIVAEQLGQVAFGRHQVAQVESVFFFGVLVLCLNPAHFLFGFDELLDRLHLLVTLGGFSSLHNHSLDSL